MPTRHTQPNVQKETERDSLQNTQIVSSKSDRRSFLTRAIGVGTVGVSAVLANSCVVSDPGCDFDPGNDSDVSRVGDPASVTDADTGAFADRPGQGRFVDADVTTVGDPIRTTDSCDSD